MPRIQELLARIGMHTEDVSNGSIQFVIAEEGEELAGVVGLEAHGEAGLLRSLVVAPGFRGQGTGLELCRRIEAESASLGIRWLYLLTETADGYFGRLGFSVIDRAEAPAAIRAARQFSEFCPASAILMCRQVGEGAPQWP